VASFEPASCRRRKQRARLKVYSGSLPFDNGDPRCRSYPDMFQPGWSFRSGFCMVCNGAYDMFSHNPLCVIPTFFLDWPSDEIHVCFPIDEKIALAREVSKTDLKLCGGRMLSDGGGVLAWLIHVRWTHFSISPCSQPPIGPRGPEFPARGPTCWSADADRNPR